MMDDDGYRGHDRARQNQSEERAFAPISLLQFIFTSIRTHKEKYQVKCSAQSRTKAKK